MEEKKADIKSSVTIPCVKDSLEKNSYIIKLINDCNMLWKRNPL